MAASRVQNSKKIVLVLDNATSHKSNRVAEFVDKYKKRLGLLFLPPYSPESNPIERVQGKLRYLVTHNTYFENLEALENAVAEYLKGHFEPNKRPAFLCRIK